MVTYILTKFGADWSIFVDDRVYTKSYSAIFPNSRANNSGCSGSIWPIIKLIQDPMGIYIVAKFSTDWSIFADASLLTKLNMANFLIQGQITRTELIPDLMIIYILTEFGANWLIFVDAWVLTKKFWTDGHRRTGSDHNSSLSTRCSGELKILKLEANSYQILQILLF